jgi:hypothetical protein
MAIRLRPGVKVRPQAHSALSNYEGYISDQVSGLPNHERVYFPDLDVTLTFGHDELDVWVQEGASLSDILTNDAELAYAQQVQWSVAQDWDLKADPGDENDYVEDPYDDYTISLGDDWVTETNHLNNGFHADVYVDEEPLDHLISFDLYHVYDGSWGGIDEDFVGVLLTPDAAYDLAERLIKAADAASY